LQRCLTDQPYVRIATRPRAHFLPLSYFLIDAYTF